jgi:hypothetical protein
MKREETFLGFQFSLEDFAKAFGLSHPLMSVQELTLTAFFSGGYPGLAEQEVGTAMPCIKAELIPLDEEGFVGVVVRVPVGKIIELRPKEDSGVATH